MKKKIVFFIVVCMLAYEVYEWVKRDNMQRALLAAELETVFLEDELAIARRNQYDNGEKRRTFKR